MPRRPQFLDNGGNCPGRPGPRLPAGRCGPLVRASDGVHFEREGGDIIAREVLKALNQQFDLTSWRKKAQ